MLITRWEFTATMRASIRAIQSTRDQLEVYLNEPEQWHGVIRRQAWAGVVHYSTAIEGNVLTQEQVEAVIAGEAVAAPDKDKIEAVNYHEAMKWARTQALNPDWRISASTFCTLQFFIGKNLGDEYEPLGRLRIAQNVVKHRDTGSLIYSPPRPDVVGGLIDELCRFVKTTPPEAMNPFILNALVHLNFEAIHPFSDGNGRVGRVACSMLMMNQGFKSQALWSLERYFGLNSLTYGEMFRRTLGHEWRPADAVATEWIEWYLSAVDYQVTEAATLMRQSAAQFNVVMGGLAADDLLGDEDVLRRRVIPIWLAWTRGSVSRRTLARYVPQSDSTLKTDFGALRQAGLLRIEGVGRGAKYVLGSRVNSWGDLDALTSVALEAAKDPVEAVRRRILSRRNPEQLLFALTE
jgi:hypothetical protein